MRISLYEKGVVKIQPLLFLVPSRGVEPRLPLYKNGPQAVRGHLAKFSAKCRMFPLEFNIIYFL